MSDKIEMTVTVNPLVSPKLYQRLRACSSPRERAIVFRALAEARLWDETMGNAHPVERGAPERQEMPTAPRHMMQERPVPKEAAPSQIASTKSTATESPSPIAPSAAGSEMAGSSDAFRTVGSPESDNCGSAFNDALMGDFAEFH